MQTQHSLFILGDPRTNGFQYPELLCHLIKFLQTLEVQVISAAIVLNHKWDVCPRASHPLIYAALNL